MTTNKVYPSCNMLDVLAVLTDHEQCKFAILYLILTYHVRPCLCRCYDDPDYAAYIIHVLEERFRVCILALHVVPHCNALEPNVSCLVSSIQNLPQKTFFQRSGALLIA
jgi:hypothetical protein